MVKTYIVEGTIICTYGIKDADRTLIGQTFLPFTEEVTFAKQDNYRQEILAEVQLKLQKRLAPYSMLVGKFFESPKITLKRPLPWWKRLFNLK